MEPLSVLVGMGIVVVGVVVGRWSRSRPRDTEMPPSGLLCSCGHGLGTHEDGTSCLAEMQRADRWDTFQHPIHWCYVPCPCRRYDGPEPPMPLREVLMWQPPDSGRAGTQ